VEGVSRPWRWLLLVLVVCLAMIGTVWLQWGGIRHTLAHWTGETELFMQFKGVLSLTFLLLTQHPPRTDPLVPIHYADASPYGINTFLEQEVEPEKVERSLALIAAAGFHWVRQEFPWEDIEIAGKGNYWDPKWDVSTWAKYDRIVDLARTHGLEVIARLDQPPAWTRKVGGAPGWTMAPPDRLEDYGDFVYAVVSRYRGRLRYYQIWNEPNIFPQWGDQPADPAGYVRMLQIAYRRAKEADPTCVILAAGLAQTTEETPAQFGPRNMSDLLYLDKMYQAGLKGNFDIMGAMVYGLWSGPYDLRVSRGRANFSRVQLLREIMVRYGDGDKAIWATEVGWNAVPKGFPLYPIYGQVNEAQQAAYAVEAYQRAAEEWPWMGVMNYWFFRRPSDAEINQVWYYFRMMEPDFRPLPVYVALAQSAKQPPRIHVGYHQEDDWALRYAGPWMPAVDPRAVLGAYTRGNASATLDFSFQGTDLALVLRNAEMVGALEITVDGRPAHVGHVWPANQSYAPTVTVASRLRYGPHQVHIAVRKGTVDLDGLIVWRASPPWWAWGVAGVITMIAVFLAISRWRCRGLHD
jgi:polysaccharide biosynthesis protein PslG